jgi:acetyl esterase/lipase
MFYFLSYLARGMNAVNVEYRLANVAKAPAAVEDVRSALHWVYANAKQYGFDTKRLVVMGESAGGHLALMAGLLKLEDGFDYSVGWKLLRDTPVKAAAIINYFGPTDLVAMLHQKLIPGFLLEWLGSVPNREDLAKRLSPVSYVRKDSPPTISIHGTKDNGVDHSQAVRLHEVLATAGVPNKLISIPGGGHGQRNWPCSENYRAQTEIFKFLEEHGIIPVIS